MAAQDNEGESGAERDLTRAPLKWSAEEAEKARKDAADKVERVAEDAWDNEGGEVDGD